MGLREACLKIGDISPATLSRIENGKIPDVDTLLRLCAWLNVSADTFSANGNHQELNREEQIVTLLRGDRDLDGPTKEALVQMISLAYKQASH